MKKIILLLALTQSICAAEAKKDDPLRPMELKMEVPTYSQQYNIPNVKLNTLPNKKIELKFYDLTQGNENKTKNLLTAKGSQRGQFIELSQENPQKLKIKAGTNTYTFSCFQGCEILKGLEADEIAEILVIWREVENQSQKEKIKETTHVYVNTMQKNVFYSCTRYPKLPVLRKGCEGEACGALKYNKAIKTVSIYERPSRASKVVGRLEKCEIIRDFEPHNLLSELGWAKVMADNKQLDTMGIKKGSLIQLTNNLGEGYFTACAGEKPIDAVQSGGGMFDYEAMLDPLLFHQSEAWIKLSLADGISGFAHKSDDFYMGYYGYDEEGLCPEDKP